MTEEVMASDGSDREEPEQQYCESCLGPLRYEGGRSFLEHALRDCIDWLARRDQFDEPVVFPGCRAPGEWIRETDLVTVRGSTIVVERDPG